jgi:GTP cyclohydrolase II
MSVERLADQPAPAGIRRAVRLPLRSGDGSTVPARMFTFDGLVDGREHVAVGLGDRASVDAARSGSGVPLVRLHSECLTGDVLGSARCDCGPQLQEAITRIAATGGYLLYLRQEGRDIGLYNKIDAYALQEDGLDTYAANRALGFGDDERDYTVAVQMLHALGVDRLDLLSNNPDKAGQLEDAGLRVERRVGTGLHLSEVNHGYLAAKAHHGGHLLHLPEAAAIGEWSSPPVFYPVRPILDAGEKA